MQPMSLFTRSLVAGLLTLFAAPALGANTLHMPVWSYDDDYTGQDDWGSLKGYEACDSTSQSPIVISSTTYKPQSFTLHYRPVSAFISSQPERSLIATLQTDKPLSFIEGKDDYYLQRIEFHSPSEHHIRDTFYPLEIHFVHTSDKHKTLILAVFADTGLPNPALTPLLQQTLPNAESKAAAVDFDPSQLLPADTKRYYAYTGSLTYPPCTEGVEWRVLHQPISLSEPQLRAITDVVGRNARLRQPVYMRTVSETQP
jgi:carbonic anhydrase